MVRTCNSTPCAAAALDDDDNEDDDGISCCLHGRQIRRHGNDKRHRVLKKSPLCFSKPQMTGITLFPLDAPCWCVSLVWTSPSFHVVSGPADVSLLALDSSHFPLHQLLPASHMFFGSQQFSALFCVTASVLSVDAQRRSFMTEIKTRQRIGMFSSWTSEGRQESLSVVLHWLQCRIN